MARVLQFVRENRRIALPSFGDGDESGEFALHSWPDNDFSGSVRGFRYQFEGEEDLLHLIVVRANGEALTTAEAREVVTFLMPSMPPALIWLRPGERSQHFYLGHDELLAKAL